MTDPGRRALLRALTLAAGAAICVFFIASCGNRVPAPLPPSIAAIRPNLAFVGQPISLTLTGSGFGPGTTVTVNAQRIPSTLVSATQMLAQVPAGLLAAPGSVSVSAGTASGAVLQVAAAGAVTTTNNGQVALYTLTLPVSAQVAIDFGPDTGYGMETWSRPAVAGTPLSIFVAGMRGDATYHMRAQVTLADGSMAVDEDHTFTTQGLAANLLPPLLSASPAAGSPSGGVELFVTNSTTSSVNSDPPAQLDAFVADTAGHVLWYYSSDNPGLYAIPRAMANGDFAVLLEGNSAGAGVREVDLAGDTVHQAVLADINGQLAAAGADFQFVSFSHDVLPTSAGHLVLNGETTKVLTDLSCCSGVATQLIGTALVDLDANWHVDWYWNSFDHLDPSRIVNGFGPYPPDWTHGNALNYTADHDLLLSLRHQSWILKLDYADGTGSGDVLWKFGWQGDFALAGGDPADWFYGQHMPEILADDGHQTTLAVFDDGNYRIIDATTTPNIQCGLGGGPACYSRAVIYRIDQDSKSAQEIWEYRPGSFSSWGGDVHQLRNGNMELNLTTGGPGNGSMVYEVTHNANPQVIWSLQDGVSTYRAYRMPSLYPGVFWPLVR